MFFFLSKFTYFFITPFNWVLALLIWRFFAKSDKTKKVLNISIFTVVMFFGNDVIYTKLVNAWQPKPMVLPAGTTYEACILLGGLGSFDKHGKGFLNSAASRLVETAILYKTGKIKRVIISGGAVYDDRPNEAPFLAKKLIDVGVAAADIIIEQRSRTTSENASYTKILVDSMKLTGPLLLVTSAIHLPRAERVFIKAGINTIGYPAHYTTLDKKFYFKDYVFPKVYVVDDWAGLIKEVVGLWGYKVFNKA